MKIFRNTKLGMLTQQFGLENTGNLLKDYQKMGLLGHNGLDWMLLFNGEPLPFGVLLEGDNTQEGKVIKTKDDPRAGVGVHIVFEDKDGRFIYVSWHFQHGGLRLKVGDTVKLGDIMGYGDSTGFSTGHHEHEGLYRCNSLNEILDKDNGYRGAIDMMPYYVPETYVLDYVNLRKKIQIILSQIDILKVLKSLFIKLEKIK